MANNIQLSKPNRVQVQVKEEGVGSRSLTVYGTNLKEVFNRIFFLLESLEKSEDNEVKIVCYKKGVTGEEKE